MKPGIRSGSFFSGYGDLWQQEDYLLPIDANPACPPDSWLSLKTVFAVLKTLPTDRILVLLDINRSQSVRQSNPTAPSRIQYLGQHTAQLAREFGIATVLSCQPSQFSYESPLLGQGLFTLAVLEGLRAAAGQPLSEWAKVLQVRLPELGQHTGRPSQEPSIIAMPEQLERLSVPTIVPSNSRLAPFPEPKASIQGMDPESNQAFPAVSPESLTDAINRPERLSLEAPLDSDLRFPGSQPSHGSQRLQAARTAPWVWGIGLLGGLILLAIGLTHWVKLSLLASGLNPRSSPERSAPPSVPTPPSTASPATPAPSALPQRSNDSAIFSPGQRILQEAQTYLPPLNPTDVGRAITRAQQVSPQDPAYPLAQRQIDRWCQDLLDLAEQQARQGNFRAAIATAQRIPKNQSSIGPTAQRAIGEWQQRVR
ncbi:MAG: hypothetical protein B0A82_06680 [Alkalinema sp. CACIAM 70d]|nr:MAG: hypothetical protein B0A82_06680 [Alkalinema sp. CACIAM 70d]